MPRRPYQYETTYETEAPDGTVTGSAEVRILYRVAFGSPEYIPPADRPDLYDPGSGPELEIIGIQVEQPVDRKMVWLDATPDERERFSEWAESTLFEELVREAAEQEECDRESALEHQAEARAEMRRDENAR